MHYYWYAGLAISSFLPIPPLLNAGDESGNATPDVAFSRLAAPPQETAGTQWIYQWRNVAGDRTMALARDGVGFWVRFPNLADFIVSADGREVAVWQAPETDTETLYHLLLDQLLPRLLAHQGRLVLHASTMDLGGHAVAFIGESGRGKSTLAASLYRAGFPCLTDDSLVLTAEDDCSFALPSYPGLRLWPPSITGLFTEAPALAPVAQYSAKRRLAMAENLAAKALPLAGIYILTEPPADRNREAITLTPLSQREACMALIGHSMQLDANAPQQALRILDLARKVAAQTPVIRLSYPREYASLPAVHAAILQQLA